MDGPITETSSPVVTSTAVTLTLPPIGTYSKITSRRSPPSPCPSRGGLSPFRSGGAPDLVARPYLVERRHQIAHHLVRVNRARGEAQPFRPARNRRVIDGLNVDVEVPQQLVADLLADHAIADHHGHDMALAPHHWQPGIGHHPQKRCRPLLKSPPLCIARLEMPYRRKNARNENRGERSGKDETGCVRAHDVDEVRGCRDIAAHHAEALGERTLDNIDLVEYAIALRDAATARSVEANRMHLVEIGERAIFASEAANLTDGRNISVHGIDGLERDDLRLLRIEFAQQLFEMRQIVVPPKPLWSTSAPYALDHGGVIHLVRDDRAIAENLYQRRERRVVRGITRSEEQRRFLLVKVGKLALEFDMIMRRAGDVPCTAGPG